VPSAANHLQHEQRYFMAIITSRVRLIIEIIYILTSLQQMSSSKSVSSTSFHNLARKAGTLVPTSAIECIALLFFDVSVPISTNNARSKWLRLNVGRFALSFGLSLAPIGVQTLVSFGRRVRVHSTTLMKCVVAGFKAASRQCPKKRAGCFGPNGNSLLFPPYHSYRRSHSVGL
jgi:hypothetical protein